MCLVGQLRSLSRTAASLRAYLIDVLTADTFVVATTDADAPSTADERAWLEPLGTLRHLSLGAAHDVLDADALARLERAPLHKLSLLHVQSARDAGLSIDDLSSTRWSHKISAQLLHASACTSLPMSRTHAHAPTHAAGTQGGGTTDLL